MSPSGIITITTDFGHKGPFTGVMKGVILGRFPDARIVDMTHEIPAQWPPEAGFWVERGYRYFPQGTVHVAIVDPGVGTERNILIVEHDGHVFLAPDNGLLGLLLSKADDASVMHLDLAKLPSLGIVETSATFHGRDIFAPVAAEIAAGNISATDVGAPTMDWIPGWVDEPDVSGGKVTGVIVTVDAFAQIAGRDFTMNETYGRVQPGDYLALINSFGVVEIARAEGNAAEGLGLERGAPITVRDVS